MRKNQGVTHDTHYEKALQYLKRYENLKVNIQKKCEKAELLRSQAESVQMNLQSDRVQTSPKDKISELITKACDLDAEIEHDKQKLNEIKAETVLFLSNLNDSREMKVLVFYHLDAKTFLQIAYDIDRSERQVYRIYEKGVLHVGELLKMSS